MATAQKRGFRFPWGGDSGRGSDSASRTDDEPSLAERLGAIPDDLGAGPFDLNAPRPDDTPVDVAPEPEASAEAEAELQPAAEADATVGADTDVQVAAEAQPAADAQPAAESEPAAQPEPGPVAANPEPEPAAAAEPQPEATPSAAWPDSDRRSANRPFSTPPAAESTPKRPAKPNPLVAGLVRAMRDAAKIARDEAVTGLRADAAARAETIRTDGATAVAGLRKAADADVAAIREWSKAEMARIRDETEARIAARKEQLVGETDDHHAATEQALANLASAVEAYEGEAAAFFDALLTEDDPARLAGLAERMPAPPTLDAFLAAPTRARAATEPRTKRAARPVETAPAPVETEPTDEPATPTDTEVDTRVEAQADEPQRQDVLDAETAAAAEAEALAGLDGQTQVIVSGLSSVASIATFKGGLMKTPGVNAVSVNAGNDGDCLFTVTHAGDADVRLAVREMAPFQTRLIADDGSTLVVVAHEPAA